MRSRRTPKHTQSKVYQPKLLKNTMLEGKIRQKRNKREGNTYTKIDLMVAIMAIKETKAIKIQMLPL